MTSPVTTPATVPAQRPIPPSTNGLAVAALVVGIVAFFVGLIPILGLVLGATAVALGCLSLRRTIGRGLGITGLVLGALAGLTSLITTLALLAGLGQAASSTAGAADLDSSTPARVAATPAASAAPQAAASPRKAVTPKPRAGADYGGYPKSEARFVRIVETAAATYGRTTNEIKGARILSDRNADACRAAGTTVKKWVGSVHDIGATGDGHGWVEIEIAPTIVVETWNNSLSDAFDDTLISKSASYYDRLGNLEEGDRVAFSGRFVADDESCLRTTNLTKTFNAADPNFLFRFSNVRAR